MDAIGQKVVVSARDFIKRLITAGVLDNDQLTEAHMAVTALGYEVARNAYDQEYLAKVRESEQRLAEQLHHKLAPDSGSGIVRRHKDGWERGVGAALATAIETTPEVMVDGELAQQLRDFLVSYHEPMDPVVSGGTHATYAGGRGDQHDEEGGPGSIYITAPRLEEYLRRRFPEKPSIRVLAVERLMGGYSKETYFVRLDEGQGEYRLVIRKDGYGLPTGSSVVNEYGVLQEIYENGLPVAEPLWVEPDSGPFAAAFMAVGHVNGKPANHVEPISDADRDAWADEFAAVLARLHRSTARPDDDVRDVLRAENADLRRRIQERERAPHPGLSLGMAWLDGHIDSLAGRPACRVHGDFGFHNMLMRDNEIAAILDWEFSHIGDPVEDLSMFRPFMEKMDRWERFIAAYEEQSGFRFDAAAARYFRVWTEIRNLVACLGSLNSLLLPQVRDVALTVAGTIYIPKYEISVLDTIIEKNGQNG